VSVVLAAHVDYEKSTRSGMFASKHKNIFILWIETECVKNNPNDHHNITDCVPSSDPLNIPSKPMKAFPTLSKYAGLRYI